MAEKVLTGVFNQAFVDTCANESKDIKEKMTRFIGYMDEIPKEDLLEALGYINAQLAEHVTQQGHTLFYKVPITLMMTAVTHLTELAIAAGYTMGEQKEETE